MRHRIAVIVALLYSLVGCATNLDIQIKSGIRTISLEPVQLADKPIVAKPGTGMMAVLTGGLGVAMYISASDLPSVYKEIVARNVDVAAEIRDTAKSELERKGYKVVEPGQPSDAKLTISGGYGIGLASLTGNERTAVAPLNVKLTRSSDGNELWRKSAIGLNADARQRAKVRLAPFEQWFKDDALVAEQQKFVAQLVTVEALDGL